MSIKSAYSKKFDESDGMIAPLGRNPYRDDDKSYRKPFLSQLKVYSYQNWKQILIVSFIVCFFLLIFIDIHIPFVDDSNSYLKKYSDGSLNFGKRNIIIQREIEKIRKVSLYVEYSDDYPPSKAPKIPIYEDITLSDVYYDNNTDTINSIIRNERINSFRNEISLSLYDGSSMTVTDSMFGLYFSDLDAAYDKILSIPLLSRPIVSVKKSLLINEALCQSPRIHDPDISPEEKWGTLNDTEILNRRKQLINYLDIHKNIVSNPPIIYGSYGVVYTAGNRDTWDRLIVSLRMLKRAYNCKLPVEIFFFPDELPSLTIVNELNSYGNVILRKLRWSKTDSNAWKNFHVKSEALLRSSFQYVLYLDSDNIPIRDPTYLIFNKQFKESGIFLWPDFFKSSPANPIWRLLGLPCRDEYETESGQILIDKLRHTDVLLLAHHMAEERSFYFKYSGGDKDTFRFALLALGKTWSGPGQLNALIGYPINDVSPLYNYFGHSILQYDHNGIPLFMHSNVLKHLGASHEGIFDTPYELYKETLDSVLLGNYGTLRNPNQGNFATAKFYNLEGMYGNMFPINIFNNNGGLKLNVASQKPGIAEFKEHYIKLQSHVNPW